LPIGGNGVIFSYRLSVNVKKIQRIHQRSLAYQVKIVVSQQTSRGNSMTVTHLAPYIYSLLTPWSRVLLEKLTGFAANQEIPRILWNNPEVHYSTHRHPPLAPYILHNY
jgi:hypothetical protein